MAAILKSTLEYINIKKKYEIENNLNNILDNILSINNSFDLNSFADIVKLTNKYINQNYSVNVYRFINHLTKYTYEFHYLENINGHPKNIFGCQILQPFIVNSDIIIFKYDDDKIIPIENKCEIKYLLLDYFIKTGYCIETNNTMNSFKYVVHVFEEMKETNVIIYTLEIMPLMLNIHVYNNETNKEINKIGSLLLNRKINGKILITASIYNEANNSEEAITLNDKFLKMIIHICKYNFTLVNNFKENLNVFEFINTNYNYVKNNKKTLEKKEINNFNM